MAYRAQLEFSLVSASQRSTAAAPAAAGFTPLEWSVIRLSRFDKLSTLRSPGRIGRFLNWLVSRAGSPGLANERLEALRRMAVLHWRTAGAIAPSEKAAFLAAGFHQGQYEMLEAIIRRADLAPQPRTFS